MVYSDQQLIHEWGSHGSENGKFGYPQGITVSPSNLVYVADTENHRVQVFNTTGKFIRSWAAESDGFYSGGIAISASGLVYVADRDNHRIDVYDAMSKFIETIASEGEGDGQVIEPSGLAFNSKGAQFIADAHNHRVQKFVLKNEP